MIRLCYRKMKATYDKDVDVLLIKLSSNKPEYGEDIGQGIVVHFDKNKKSCGNRNIESKEKPSGMAGTSS